VKGSTNRRLSGAIALVLCLGAGAPTASAWCRMTSSPRLPSASVPCILPDPTTDPPEQYLEWRRPCTTIASSSTASSTDMSEDDVYGVLARSIATWEAVTCDGAAIGFDIEVLADQATCDAPLYRDDGGNANTVLFIADWGDRLYDPAAFAVTTVWHRRSTGEILDADMEINERRGPYGICPPTGCVDRRTVDLENVVTHELGHYLGLAHSTELDATMYVSAVAGETIKRDLHDDDIAGICTIYPPGAPAGECDYTARGGDRLDCETGCAVSAPGRNDGGSPAWGSSLAIAGLALRRRRRRS
jgi:MYXO-CTERM domain-containing protein